MSGTIGICVDMAARYSQFWSCAFGVAGNSPPNTMIRIKPGSDRSVSRNWMVADSLDRGSEWLLFLDDDHGFHQDLLRTLLAADQPVVGSLYLRRAAPFLPIAFAEKDEHGFWPLDLRAHGPNELVSVRGVGTGGMLVRSEVFRAIDPPWFLHTTEQSEDLYFCDRVHDAGFPIYVHTGASLGHIAPALVWPTFHEGEWSAGVQYAEGMSVVVPIEYPDRVEA